MNSSTVRLTPSAHAVRVVRSAIVRSAVALAIVSSLVACSGDEDLDQELPADAGDVPPNTESVQGDAGRFLFSVGGVVEGLAGTVVLQLGEEQVTVTKNGAFTFERRLRTGSDYEVVVAQQPENEFCIVDGGQGTVGTDDVADIAVFCEAGNAGITGLVLSVGEVEPAFSAGTTRYRVDVPLWIEQIGLAPELTDSDVDVYFNSEEYRGEPTVIALEPGQNTVEVETRAESSETRTYTVEIYRATAVVEAAYGKANAPSEAAQLGSSMSLDGKWLAVGAPGHSSDAVGINGDEGNLNRSLSGAVYIFERDDEGWKQQAFIKAANPDAEDLFGFAVALRGNTLVVGAPEEDGDSPGVNGDDSSNEIATSGAVYVFERTGADWAQVAYLKAAEPTESASFGHSVALDRVALGGAAVPGGNGALWRLVVGAYHDRSSGVGFNPAEQDMAAPYSGAAYIFDNDGSGWMQTAHLKASNTDPGDAFGTSVALADNVVVVGAPEEQSAGQGSDADPADDSAMFSGAAYVFDYDVQNATWAQTAYLKADNSAADFRFGTALSIDGQTIAVGSLTEPSARTGVNPEAGNTDAPEAGSVHIFDRDAEGKWTQSAYLKASNSDQRDHFGAVLELRGNALAVAAPLEASAQPGIQPPQDDNTAPGAGAVYLFFRNDGEWSQQAYLKASNAQPGDNFGLGIGFDGVQLAVGAPYEDSSAGGITSENGGPNNAARAAGAVYWFR